MDTQKIQTKYFGETTIDKHELFTFASGLPGFAEETSFVILDLPGNQLFHVLQSVNTPDLAFVITNPHQFYPNYSFELEDHVAQQIDIEQEADTAVAVIVTLKEPFEKSTLNLKAPLILNTRSRLGKQHILQDDTWFVKAPVTTPEMSETEGD
ncbi:flagellar assembly protein FliW [Lentibacillus sp. JNUCC-1]|uniref:flagellar assembly protein FliW n=1 Tax=Lentibacillus sp. JNUCC-1 TaxID=2654513 RepID=UPI0018D20429|nr:flagellar assembly protein FliW [Lentibacillus sp. JNUCC-1]